MINMTLSLKKIGFDNYSNYRCTNWTASYEGILIVKLIESGSCNWSPCAKMSRDVYILPRDKDPRFHDELKIRVGDLKNFANSLFYLAPTKLSTFCSPFFISFGFPKIHTKWNISIRSSDT